MRRGLRVSVGVALIVALGGLSGCASKPSSSASGANTLEGGVKIPGATPTPAPGAATTVNVTLGDTKGARGPDDDRRVPRDRTRR